MNLLAVQKSEISGNGVFAREDIPRRPLQSKVGHYCTPVNICHGIQIDDDFVIGGLSKYDTELEDAHFFNHSCNPNAGIKGQILFVAMRDIQADEEVVFDYAMCLYKGAEWFDYSLECLCGDPDCHGKITNEDWRIPELQKRYHGYFSWYLQDKIDKLKACTPSPLP